ncbi:hypothetical protein DEO23_01920 [Brachybacterium endophyticum]|uniref:PLD phosphodiesterase domain-containing protein n=2 Tax=Brachybacterium endophyticum TaxID=2182385 RepID=A0A2U2RPW7_9MICO|nr:hypothetical protein DEO23_01920 [Brachybacterium endophyticum]
MLKPDTTVLLTDALQPPPGYDVDTAVATTYSLNLTALLVAPMTFALADVENASTVDHRDPAQLLDAVKRYMSRTTVFCQVAGIHVPASYSRLTAFLEDSIQQVEPKGRGSLFHPKLWAIRYRRPADGGLHHRVVVASRNLTLDSSWDTALVLDEHPNGAIDAAPAADMVGSLPGLALDPMEEDRRASIQDLCASLRGVHLEAPHPFTGGNLLPLGLDTTSRWPFPAESSERLLAISPFLQEETLRALEAGSPNLTLVTRAESADQLGASALSSWDVNVIDSGADYRDGAGGAAPTNEFGMVEEVDGAPRVAELTGLHAKTIVLDHPDGTSSTVTGSANLTQPAWHRNIEFDAILHGPTGVCGVEAALGKDAQDMGLRTILQPYTPEPTATADPSIETGYRLEEFHRALARSRPRPQLDIVAVEEDRVSARLSIQMPDDLVGTTRIWLLTVPGQDRELAATTTWDLAAENITPFLAVETTAGSGEARATRRCLIKVPIIGDVIDRRQRALASLLNNSDRVLRYLALLLGFDDPSQAVPAQDVDDDTLTVGIDLSVEADNEAAQPPQIVLFEPLVRAAGQDIGRLASVAEQVDELRRLPNADALIPPEFLQMWDVVLQIAGGRKRA